MYPRAFHYHRAGSLKEAVTMLAQLGEDGKLLAGGQSLIPLMKLRFANPKHLVDLNFVPGISYIKEERGTLRFGALTRHAEIEYSATAAKIPILHDCAAGIADVQVRNRGTIGGSIAEADPSGDWATVLSTLETTVRCLGKKGERTLPLSKFIMDAYTTALGPEEIVSEIIVKHPPKGSGGAYLAFKRSAPVYPTASAAVQLTMEGDACRGAAIALGCVGLTAIKATEAEAALRGQKINDRTLNAAAEAARAAADPQPDMRGSAEYKRMLVGSLVKRAIEAAVRRARGEQAEVSHIYA
ncbi:MAG TPA: xanthine dehydrogenase family protein subunit M [Terriglobales bacterium]|jgi:aerobic carbon-monoxide dehydrogenase medium subunit|nr:xanthine dehydrogenase family protein subunit M [Terriglobales bacterium]